MDDIGMASIAKDVTFLAYLTEILLSEEHHVHKLNEY